MRQSANNPKIEYSTNWRYALEVLGKGKVCEKDLDRQGDKPGDRAWTGEYTGAEGITAEQFANRMILRTAMLRHGFKPYDCEWWHFTLKDEPYPDTYFTFPVQQLPR